MQGGDDEYGELAHIKGLEVHDFIMKERKKGDLIDGMLHYSGGTTWRCEDEIKSTLDAWKDEYPHLCVTSRDRSSAYAAARQIVQIVGEANAPEFVRRAAEHSRRNMLAVSTLYSLIYYRDKWFAKKKQDNPYRYLEGLE